MRHRTVLWTAAILAAALTATPLTSAHQGFDQTYDWGPFHTQARADIDGDGDSECLAPPPGTIRDELEALTGDRVLCTAATTNEHPIWRDRTGLTQDDRYNVGGAAWAGCENEWRKPGAGEVERPVGPPIPLWNPDNTKDTWLPCPDDPVTELTLEITDLVFLDVPFSVQIRAPDGTITAQFDACNQITITDPDGVWDAADSIEVFVGMWAPTDPNNPCPATENGATTGTIHLKF